MVPGQDRLLVDQKALSSDDVDSERQTRDERSFFQDQLAYLASNPGLLLQFHWAL